MASTCAPSQQELSPLLQSNRPKADQGTAQLQVERVSVCSVCLQLFPDTAPLRSADGRYRLARFRYANMAVRAAAMS